MVTSQEDSFRKRQLKELPFPTSFLFGGVSATEKGTLRSLLRAVCEDYSNWK
jgi:hypothetical protein